MTINEAANYFEAPDIKQKMTILQEIGIGHLQLGQTGNTLSGGEAQRIKLAKEILINKKGKNLYLFDEPSSGLHYFDITNLIKIFEKLIMEGHSIIFIEHNSALIDIANHEINLNVINQHNV